MKTILSDFDGVLTEQTEEALRVRQILRDELVKAASAHRAGPEAQPEAAIDRLLQDAESEMERFPSRHGWRSQGRVTAFANEDLFIRNNGLGACLDRRAESRDPQAAELRLLLQARGHAGFTGLAQNAYMQMVSETHAGKLKPMDAGVAQLFESWLRRDHRIVVVSNSGTDRILQLLRGAGIDAASHEARPDARIRVRGNARKFELGEERWGFQVDDYFVDVNRPAYERILKEERPDVVIGDVFSLDLAVPYRLMTGGELLLRRRHYTPAWASRFCESFGGGTPRLRQIDRIEELESL